MSYPESLSITEARYYRAESYFRSKDSQKALDSYYEIYADDKFTFANRVVGRVAELEFKLGRYEKSIEANQKLNRIATNSREKHSSWTALMEAFYLTNSFDSCLVYANRLIQDASVSAPTQNRAALMSGKIAMAKGDYATAQDEFLTIVNNASDESGAEAKYRIAEIQYLSKLYKQSYETLIDLNKKYQAYPDWIGKAFLLLADNSQAMGDTFQAKATLKSLIDKFPLETIREEAKVKLKMIEQAEIVPDTVKKDSIDN
jgi:TolA-binding protein